jgi:tellurite resistance protein
LFPSVLAPHLGGCGTRAFSTQTVLAAFHLLAQAEGATKGIESQKQTMRIRKTPALQAAWTLPSRASIL